MENAAPQMNIFLL